MRKRAVDHRAVELFVGAGGLAVGVSRAGFTPVAVVEWDNWACETIRANKKRAHPDVKAWPDPVEDDVRNFLRRDAAQLTEEHGDIALVSGGPPCQPFSLGGKHAAHADERNMWPQAADALRRFNPQAFIFENVKGLTRPAFSSFYEYVFLQLSYPDIEPKPSETWQDHLRRLERAKTSGRAPAYNVVREVLNAADFGVPQRRERVFLVGFRGDLGIDWSFPKPTHSKLALQRAMWVTGDYWDEHRVASKARPEAPANRAQLEIETDDDSEGQERWRTVRDAIRGLNPPRVRGDSSTDGIFNHVLQPGARPYPGHTGSPLDLPAKTLKAGVHGVPGGENMIDLGNGDVRYFTVRESARLQTFPDEYVFNGAWSECMRQLGNAVPVTLARVVAKSVRAALENASKETAQ